MRLTKKEAIRISVELWEWMFETGSKFKEEWPGWEKYGKMDYDCPLCEYQKRNYGNKDCEGLCIISSCHGDFAYGDWDNAYTKSDRKKYAGLFLEQLKELL